MITSIKLFIRSLKRNKLFSSINILGLTVGFFSSILIYMYVQNEMSYDDFHVNGDRIYRVNQTFIWGEDNPNLFSSTGPGVGYSILADVPEVEQVVRIYTANDMLPITFEKGGQESFYNDEYVLAADSTFFDVFSFPLLHGDKSNCLTNPRSVILSYDVAMKFFGRVDVIGETVEMNHGDLFKVTGVFAPFDKNSYLDDVDLLISLNSIERIKTSDWNWMWTMFETYILINKGVDSEVVQAKLDELPRKHAGQTLKAMGYTYDDYLAAGKEWNLYMQPFTDIYLHSQNIYNRISGVGDIKIVAALIGSAVFLLILSCINFINLSTAKFTSRAQDVALRKVLGGSRATFIKRFFGESLIYCLVATMVSIALVFYTVPMINQSLGTDLQFSMSAHPFLILFIGLLIVIVSIVAGFYPFVFFDSFKPVSAMKGELKTGRKGVGIRNGMLVTQYVLSFLLIIGTVTIYKQLNHWMNANLGFEKENLLSIENAHWTGSLEEFANELGELEGVKGTSVCDAVPLLISNGDQFIPDEPDAGSVPLNYALADENYVDLLDVEMIVGRYFNETFSSDTTAIVLNETAARTIGWPIDESIINKKVTNWSGTYHVIGVTRDFNFWTLHAPIEPFAIFHSKSNAQGGRPLTRILVKSSGPLTVQKELKEKIKAKWEEFAPARPYEEIVIADHFARSYQTEERFGNVLSFFAILTIIIASLGLFGIVVFSLEQKLKEIGVRKVLGASVSSIVILFSKSYVKLLVIAFAIATPIGYYFMNSWLSDFEYKIELGVGIFVMAFLVLMIVTLAISMLQTMKASLMNPSEILKDE
ncbi:ABC transporter permease [Ekhidna sp.]|uniref:ABC transporter permease n=1 Tax=Ekhidna sp. TaxID=2608089 RepID=UPI003BAC1E5C